MWEFTGLDNLAHGIYNGVLIIEGEQVSAKFIKH